MKNNILLLVLFFANAFVASAQESCDEQVDELKTLAANHQLNEAYVVLEASECVQKHREAYKAVEEIFIYKIESAADEDEKQNFLNSLLKFYDDTDLRNPGNTDGNRLKKVVALQRFASGSENDVYKILDSEFKNNFQNFNDPAGIALYFDLFFKKFSAKEKGMTENDLLARHDALLNKLDHLAGLNPDAEREYRTAAAGISASVKPVLSCEKLIDVYSKALPSKKTDVQWLTRAASNLRTYNCTTSPIYLSIASQWNDVEPSSASANDLAIAYSRGKQPAKAIEYYNIAADLEKNPAEKSKIYYTIAASLLGSNKTQSLDFAKKAIAADSDNGKAYLLLAQIYSSAQDCGATPLEKKAIYILASRTALTAAEKTPSLKATAERQSELFLKNAPSVDEIRKEGLSGKMITYNCWIKASVTLP